MIHGMTCRETRVPTAISFIVLLAGLVSELTPLLARSKDESSLAHQSTPKLDIRVYSFSGVSAWTLQAAETEARTDAASRIH
jgi:hypothetical protein